MTLISWPTPDGFFWKQKREERKEKVCSRSPPASWVPRAHFLLIPVALNPCASCLPSRGRPKRLPWSNNYQLLSTKTLRKYQPKLGQTWLAQDLILPMDQTNHRRTKRGLTRPEDHWSDLDPIQPWPKLYQQQIWLRPDWSGWTWIWQLESGLVSTRSESDPGLYWPDQSRTTWPIRCQLNSTRHGLAPPWPESS